MILQVEIQGYTKHLQVSGRRVTTGLAVLVSGAVVVKSGRMVGCSGTVRCSEVSGPVPGGLMMPPSSVDVGPGRVANTSSDKKSK